MKVFEYVAWLKPTEKEFKDGIGATIIVQPKTVMANDQGAALLMAGKDIPEEYTDKLSRVGVAVRPFCAEEDDK